MSTEERLARLRDSIARLEQHAARHRAELARLYELLAVHERALGTVSGEETMPRAA